jgi:hypothetical protein
MHFETQKTPLLQKNHVQGLDFPGRVGTKAAEKEVRKWKGLRGRGPQAEVTSVTPGDSLTSFSAATTVNYACSPVHRCVPLHMWLCL